MKKRNRILGIGLSLMTIGMAFGCVSNTKNTDTAKMAHLDNTITEAVTRPEVSDSDTEPKNNTVKIALLLDTSNSMDGLIDQAKAQLWDIVNKFGQAKCGNDVRPDLRIALYQYGNDGLSAREGYLQQVLNFSNDLDEISEKLFSLTTNGGEEYCGQVINTSLKQLEWGNNPDNLKMVFIAGNEPFTQGRFDYRDAAFDAKEKSVIVNTIFCGDHQQGIESDWKNGALLTGGEYSSIDHNRQVVHIATPYDQVIIDLNKKLNGTYVSYGALGSAKIKQQSAQDANAYELQEAVAVKRAVSKSSSLYKNKKWDLVDASDDADFEVSEIVTEDLPDELKGKSTSEIEAYIETKKSERQRIQQKIREASAKRDAYIAEHQADNAAGELENAMMRAIVKQAGERGIRL